MNVVSYNMLKKLPSKLIANIHYCLTRIWAEKKTLDWLSDRWLVAITGRYKSRGPAVINTGGHHQEAMVQDTSSTHPRSVETE